MVRGEGIEPSAPTVSRYGFDGFLLGFFGGVLAANARLTRFYLTLGGVGAVLCESLMSAQESTPTKTARDDWTPVTRQARPSRTIVAQTLRWVGQSVKCYIRSIDHRRLGPYAGIVRGLATNQATVDDEGGSKYFATGLLVEIRELGRNQLYGEWPVIFGDAEIVTAADFSN